MYFIIFFHIVKQKANIKKNVLYKYVKNVSLETLSDGHIGGCTDLLTIPKYAINART